MKNSLPITLALAMSFTFLVGCSSIPEIKPYQHQELTVEDAIENSSSDDVFEETATAVNDTPDSIPNEDEVPAIAEQKDPEPEAPKTKSKKPASTSSSDIVKSAAFKNGFYTFSQNCAMKSQPKNSSADAGSVSAGKKLWLDGHNGQWLKAYKKAGAVYISAECIK